MDNKEQKEARNRQEQNESVARRGRKESGHGSRTGSKAQNQSRGDKSSRPSGDARALKESRVQKAVRQLRERREQPEKSSGKETPGGKLRIIPLGGLEEIGMNITAFEYEDSIVVVDCGMAFPSEDMYGVDCVIPDTTYLQNNLDKVRGFVITHGHEDHIGALPYVLRDVNVPIYATRLTMGIIEGKLTEHGMMNTTERHAVKFGQTVTLGAFRVEFIKTNHSIVDAAALAITSPVGTVIHTGDFKVDFTPVYGDAIDLQRFAELGRKGVLALLCDSTNAERPGYTPSEKTVGKTFDMLFSEHRDSRLLIATFASNVDRVQQIINSAYKFGRKVVVEGRSMVNIISIAQQLGCITIPANTLIDIDELKNYPEEKTVIVTTGSQGESMAALSRIAEGTHRKIKVGPGDTVIFSSNPIPGNEKAVTNTINLLLMKGANVISSDVHASGHPCQEEIKLIYTLVQPKFCVPVHGEYKHLKAHERICKELGYDDKHIFLLQSGDVLEFTKNSAKVTGRVQVGEIMVDGLGVGDVGNVVLRDRQHLAEDGVVFVTFVLDQYMGDLVSGPEIASRGFVYLKEADDMMVEAQAVARDAIETNLARGISDWSKLKSAVRDDLGDYFWKKTKRRPMIIAMIMEA